MLEGPQREVKTDCTKRDWQDGAHAFIRVPGRNVLGFLGWGWVGQLNQKSRFFVSFMESYLINSTQREGRGDHWSQGLLRKSRQELASASDSATVSGHEELVSAEGPTGYLAKHSDATEEHSRTLDKACRVFLGYSCIFSVHWKLNKNKHYIKMK